MHHPLRNTTALTVLLCTTFILILSSSLLLATSAQDASQATIRGVKLRDQSRYTQPTFVCFDSSATLTPAQINDDYCDCDDGSDEPGTSACIQARFWCANKGAKGKKIPASRVNDGVCDCCDGSDEWNHQQTSSAACPNICEEAGRAAREALELEVAATEAGILARLAHLEAAKASLATLRAKQEKWEKLMIERKEKLEAARIVKEAEEEIEKAEQGKRDAAEAERLQAEAAANFERIKQMQAAAGIGESTEAPAAPAENAQAALVDPVQVGTPPSHPESTESSETPATPTTPEADAPKENFPYPPEYMYDANKAAETAASTETPAAPAAENFPYPAEYAYQPAGASDASEPAPPPPEQEYSDENEDDDDDQNQAQAQDNDYVHPGGASKPTTPTVSTSVPSTPTKEVSSSGSWLSSLLSVGSLATSSLRSLGELEIDIVSYFETAAFGSNSFERLMREDELSWKWDVEEMKREEKQKKNKKQPTPTTQNGATSSPAASAARTEYDALNEKVSRLQRKMDELSTQLQRNYGQENEFMHMDGKCYEIQVKQYTYEVCPYSSAKQKEGSSSTSLGNWETIEVDASGTTLLKFSGGQSCWQGPQRSMTVKLKCGREEKVTAVDEPNKCVYEMIMESPAVCQPTHLQALQLNMEGDGNLVEEEDE